MNKFYIIGVGPGREDYILPIARHYIERADCFIGAKRILMLFHRLGKKEIIFDGKLDMAISYIRRFKDKERIVFLVSGDPGMYSPLEKIAQVFRKNEYAVIPGISTLQLSFARIGQSWFDAKIISLHARKIDNLAAKIRRHPKVFLLTDARFPPNKIAAYLLKAGIENRRAVILENLSYPDERILDTDLQRLTKKKGFGLCVMIIEALKLSSSQAPKLYGIGLGPGDPGLVTLKAKEMLDRVDIVFAPKSSDDAVSLAAEIVEAVTEKRKNLIELTFPMTRDENVLNKYWMNAARTIARHIRSGKEAAFVTIGDPSIYSTYGYLSRILSHNFKDIVVETIPGISAFNAASCRVQLPLAEGREKLAVVPVAGDLEGVRRALIEFDTIALMKVGAKLGKVTRLLKELGLIDKAILISRVGHKNEKVIRGLSGLRDKKAGYLSVILVRKK